MNDPNGLIHHEGEYHLFYQCSRDRSTECRDMSWGHAVSTDLLSWENLGVAIPAEPGFQIYSGSAVIDEHNTAGFGAGAMVAIYTAAAPGHQAQHLAYSLDRGRSWTQFDGNPVLDRAHPDFRDPKVFWHEPTERWIMVVVLAPEKTALLYASPNLHDWLFLSDFGPRGLTDGIWECPDLYPLGDRWILQLSVGPTMQYWVGQFDGRRFTSENPPDTVLRLDHGPDFYAGITWEDAPGGRRLGLGWASNWFYARDIPTTPWKGAQSLPRLHTLARTPAGPRLLQQPIPELATRRGPAVTSPEDARGQHLEIHLRFTPGDLELALLRGPHEETLIGYDAARQQIYLDRAKSGDTSFHPGFPGRYTAPLAPGDGEITLRIFLDRTLVEVFGNGGEVVMTAQVFPGEGSQGIALNGPAKVLEFNAWPLAGALTRI
jgi:sucrose-6-phosphate hydrolase SacC (GH32 family)